MSDQTFILRIITPAETLEREIKHLRLKDETGFFGIMKDHIDFLTILIPSLCYYTDANDEEVFLALDRGMLNIRGGEATITSREVYEDRNAEKLAGIIENTIIRRDESEKSFSLMLEGIERSFMEKTAALARGK